MHFMNGFCFLFLAKYLVKAGSFAFSNVLGHIFYSAPKNAFTELNLDNIAQFQIVSRLYDLSVYQNVVFGACVIGNGSAFDNAGYF